MPLTGVTNAQLMSVLLDLKGDVGGLKSTAATVARELSEHAASDEAVQIKVAADLAHIKESMARRSGFLKAMVAISGIATTIAGYFIGSHHQ